MTGQPEIMALKDIAEYCGVSYHTAKKWRQREILPEPEYTVASRPIWLKATIKDWAEMTERVTPEDILRAATQESK